MQLGPQIVAEMTQDAINFLLRVNHINEISYNERTKCFQTLLLRYQKLSAEHRDLFAEVKGQAIAQSTVEELHKKISKTEDVDALRMKSKTWQTDLGQINSYLENFPEANMFALRAMNKVRSESSDPADPSDEVTIKEHLVVLFECVRMLKFCGVDLLKAAIHIFRTLWTEEEPPMTIDVLAASPMISGERMD